MLTRLIIAATALALAAPCLAGSTRTSRFEYEATVRSEDKDPRIWIQRAFAPRRQVPPLEAHREEENVGPLRRQFVSESVQALPPGRYRLEITVRDLVAGTDAKASVEFAKEGAPK